MSQTDKLYQPVSRSMEVFTGLLSLLLGAAIAAFGVLCATASLKAGPGSLVGAAIGAIALALGACALALGWRLFLGHSRRRDGGLLSPLALRISSVVFLVMPVAPILILVLNPEKGGSDVFCLLEIGTFLGFSIACWRLARFRATRLRDSDVESGSEG